MKSYIYLSLAFLCFTTSLWSQALQDCKNKCTIERVVYKDAYLGVMPYNRCVSMQEKGAVIQEIIENSAAEKANLQESDVITYINDIRILDNIQLVKTLKDFEPNETVTIVFRRIRKTFEIDIVLGAKSQDIVLEETCCDATYQVDVFPNPVSGKLNISILDNREALDFNFKVYNLQGLLINSTSENKGQINFEKQVSVEDLPDGMYLLEVSTKQNTTVKKFIVKR